jgi:hypothetical protein
MLVELAIGMDPPMDVATRHGFSASDFQTLNNQPWFQRALTQKRQEVAESGWNFKSKMSMLAEDMLLQTYRAASLSDSPAVKLEAAKYLTKVADLEPRASAQAQAGGGFMININLTNPAQQSQKLVIDVEPDLPPIPDYGVADFPVNTDLIGYTP